MTNEDKKKFLLDLANNPELLHIARLAIEDALVQWRDSRLSEVGRGNGLVIKEMDGQPSSVIRFGAEYALSLGLEAIAKSLTS